MANLKDFATSTVATAPSPATSGTSLVVESGHGARFPSATFYATAHPDGELPTLDNAELLQVTNVSTDTLTIVRAQGDTTAKSIATGWRISNVIRASDYANLAGVSGGQTLSGSNTSSENLTLQSNSSDNKTGDVIVDSDITQFSSDRTYTATPVLYEMGGGSGRTHTLNFANANFLALRHNPTWVLQQSAFGFGLGNLFANQSIIKNANAVAANFAPFFPFIDQATYRADAETISFTLDTTYSFVSNPKLDTINSGAISVVNFPQFDAQFIVNSGATVTNRYGFRANAPTVNGTLTSQAGIAIAGLSNATNNTSVLIGTTTIPSGNYAIYSSSTNASSFAGDVSVPDEAYGSGWNGSTEVPTKNAVYDALNGNAIGYVNHGATAGTSRPSDFAVVLWYGSVEPTNATNNDIWIDTA